MNVHEQAAIAQAALDAGTLTQATPLAWHALNVAVRYEMFDQFTAPDQRGTEDAEAEASRRFLALPKG